MIEITWLSKWPIKLGFILVGVGTAYFAGVRVADAINFRRQIEFFVVEQNEVRSTLKGVGCRLEQNLSVGDKSYFQDRRSEGDAKSLIGGGLLVFYLDPECRDCITQLRNIESFARDNLNQTSSIRILLTSRSTSEVSLDTIGKYVGVQVDSGRQFGASYNITLLPTVIALSGDNDRMIVRYLFLRPLSPKEILHLIRDLGS